MLIITLSVFGQSKNDSIFYIIKTDNFNIYDTIQTIKDYSTLHDIVAYQPPESSLLFVYDIIKLKDGYTSDDSYFLKIAFDNKTKYLSLKNTDVNILNKDLGVSVVDLYAFFNSVSEEYRNNIKAKALLFSKALALKKKKELLDYFEKFNKSKIGIITAQPYENYGFTGARFEIINFSKKTIKYITFKFHGLNPVDDKVYLGKNMLTVSKKGIGPVEYLETGSWEFEYAWSTDIVEKMVLKSMDIEYVGGSKLTVLMNDNLYFEEDIFEKLKIYSIE